MDKIVQTVRKSFNSNVTLTLKWRKDNLNALMRLLDENEKELCDALKKDLNKHSHETVIMEFGVIKNGIVNSLNNLDKWVQPQKQTPIIQARGLYSTYIQSQPYGVALIIGAWNYPYQVLLVPLVGAIAAGCCAVLKPSELSAHSSALLENLWPKYFDRNFINIINGGVKETTELLQQRFDFIFYTGNTAIGKVIMEAASKYIFENCISNKFFNKQHISRHLTPVCLECGGKSPVYIDSTADLETTAKRLLWGRFVNAGQT